MPKKLVIVESSTKANTINKMLGSDYVVKASVGHVRDLPSKSLAVDIENDFQPEYEVIRGKQKVINELRSAAKNADEIILAGDPDREGEAICAHLADELASVGKPIHRVEFNEITPDAVRTAMANPRDIDADLVDAQKARRVLDRVVGYQISPILWRNVRRGLSAGRVQSVAVRLICDREQEIRAFKPEEYWSVTANVEGSEKTAFDSRLFRIGDEKGGFIGGYGFGIDEARATEIVDDVRGQTLIVGAVAKREVKQKPKPPFITSTLQQDAANRLNMTTRRTMQMAQALYEGVDVGEGSVGLITYMRTDSTRVADSALKAARAFIQEEYGAEYRPTQARRFPTKKGAQDAHEAIRPTDVECTPESMKGHLDATQLALYDLIWRRFVASQTADAVLDRTTIDIRADHYAFRTTGSVVRFPGFRRIYEDSSGADDNGNGDQSLPVLVKGDELKLHKLAPKQHFTQPPPRYTEASIVKEMEARGIGRPSTYAAIISTILAREYVKRLKGSFQPTEVGELVTKMLVGSFPEILDADFTARMESELDQVEEGSRNWVTMMRDFYGPFTKALSAAPDKMYAEKKNLEEVTDLTCEVCDSPMVVKWGRHGKFLGCSTYPECRGTRPIDGKRAPEPVTTGVQCPECGDGELLERTSRRGKVFYGCSAYPKCTFVAWDPPVEDAPCPECPAPFLTLHKTTTKQYYQCYRRKECGYKSDSEPLSDDDRVSASGGGDSDQADVLV